MERCDAYEAFPDTGPWIPETATEHDVLPDHRTETDIIPKGLGGPIRAEHNNGGRYLAKRK